MSTIITAMSTIITAMSKCYWFYDDVNSRILTIVTAMSTTLYDDVYSTMLTKVTALVTVLKFQIVPPYCFRQMLKEIILFKYGLFLLRGFGYHTVELN